MIQQRLLRRRPWLLATGVAVLLLLVAYVAWLALSARTALNAARDDAEDVRAALKAGDEKRTLAALDQLEEHASTAHSRTSGLTWRAIGTLPYVGDDADAVATASRAITQATAAVKPAIEAGGLDAGRFAPRKGGIKLDAIASLRTPLGKAASTLASVRSDVDDVDADGLIGSLGSQWRDFASEVDDAATTVDAAYRATDVVPAMLGADHPTRTLVVFDTPAEPRATGGMPGSVAELIADKGSFRLGQQRAASSFPELKQPVLPISTEERKRFGPELGTFVMDAAFTPHFPRTAELIAARWKQEYHHDVDGVVALDPVALGYLMKATGPVTVGDVKLTSENLADYLMHQVYIDIPKPAEQDLFFQAVVGAVFERLQNGDMNAGELLAGAGRAVQERRLFVHSFDADVQGPMDGTRIAGEVTEDTKAAPQVGAYVNDATGSKMGWYLDYDVKVTGSCTHNGREMTGTMTLHSTLKKGTKLPSYITGGGVYGTPPGEHLVSVEIMGPQGGTLGGIVFDGQRQPNAEISPYRSHPMTSVAVFLDPGDTHTITWSMGTHSRHGVQVDVGAGVRPVDQSSALRSC